MSAALAPTGPTPRSPTLFDAFLLSFGVILVAELGDKSQLMALAFAALVGAAPHAQQPAPADDQAQTQALNLSAYAELLRADVRPQKVAILSEIMGFTEAEGDRFWPIYREYDAEMTALGDERIALIDQYVRDYAKVTDQAADRMARQALALETKRQAVKAKYYSFEAANVRHEHEYHVWERVPLAPGKVILPGVVTHSTDLVEHPELVSERIQRFARLVGAERVIASTDCGFGGRTHPQIAWAKLRSLSEGAALASAALAAHS